MKYLAIFILTSWLTQSTGPQCTDFVIIPVTDTLVYELPTLQAARKVICDQIPNIGVQGGQGMVLTGIKLDSIVQQ